MIAQLLGTPIVNAVLEQLESDDILASPASLDSFWVREPNLVPLGGPYQTQAMNGLYWDVTDGGGEGKKVCSLIQDNPYGEAGQEGLEFAAENLDIELGVPARCPAPPPAADFKAPHGQPQGATCGMVVTSEEPPSPGAAHGTALDTREPPRRIGHSPPPY